MRRTTAISRSSSGTKTTAASTTTGANRASRSVPAPEPVSPSMKIRPDSLVVAAASISPISIEPESPMKIRAGLKLCGRKPRQAPASTAASSAGE